MAAKKRKKGTHGASRLRESGPVKYHAGKFPPRRLDWSALIRLIGPASAALARYDGLLTAIPNADILLSPLTTQEAVLSSKIEGTYTTMGEVLEYEAGSDAIAPDRVDDIQEVINYRSAMRQAVELMHDLPVCGRLLKQCHATLLSGVRGHDKARGRFRTIQNYIGVQGRPVEEARFVPVEPEHVAASMSQWEKYLHQNEPDALVQLAIAHAEFESIHPFLDGNGRLGRMIIPLFLFEKRLLHAPMFYLSEYLQAHDNEYKDRLLAVSRDDDWTGWCEFFLQAIVDQAAANQDKAQSILELYETRKLWMVQVTHSQYSIVALDYVFSNPVFSSTRFKQGAGIPRATARRMLATLVENDLLVTIREGKGQRPAMYAFAELLNITEGRTIF